MRDRMHHQLELVGDSATVYVQGCLDAESVETLLEACGALPAHVRTLRIDLRALGVMSGEATSAVRRLLEQWRSTRDGEFRLSTSHLIATCNPTVAKPAAPTRLPMPGRTIEPLSPVHS
jgi:anti-anti-sigma regulatory factor